MNDPKVSIVIPVFNGHDYLREAIDSALDQTYSNKEVLVVNDGSNDQGRTEDIALSYGDRIQYLWKENGGVASALNLAIERMSGEYFSWLSHDDLYTPDKVSREVAAAMALGREDVVIYCDYAVFSDDPATAHPVRLREVPPSHFRYWITVENQLHGCTLLIPRAAFDKAGRFDVSLRTTQDYDLWFRMAAEFSFVHIPDVLVKARSHAEQGSHKMADIALAECNALLSGFVTGLSPQEILTATKKPLGAAYSDIAESMFRRGFNEAGMVADQLSHQNARPASKATLDRAIHKASRWRDRIYGMGRRALPRPVKSAIKSLWRSGHRECPSKVANEAQLQKKFTEVYEKNIFGGRVSRSGEGSDLVQTDVIRQELPRVIREFGIKSFLDAPCGDWYWMSQTKLGVERYIGVDIVKPLVDRNQREFGNASISFRCLNLADAELPQVDLIFSRDCLVHLSLEDALRIVANFKRSASKYLLTTTFVNRDHNNDLIGKDSFWRPLNMQLPPFNFPPPLLLINEQCTEEGGQYTDKCLGLWRLSDIRCDSHHFLEL